MRGFRQAHIADVAERDLAHGLEADLAFADVVVVRRAGDDVKGPQARRERARGAKKAPDDLRALSSDRLGHYAGAHAARRGGSPAINVSSRRLAHR